jgi:hypothetical protein
MAMLLSAPPAFAQDAATDLNMPWKQLISASGPYFYPEGSSIDVARTYGEAQGREQGEKVDDGVGEMTKEDMQDWMAASRAKTVVLDR